MAMDRYSQLVRRSLGRIRAQTEEEDREDDDFTTGFINFRTRHDSRPGLTAAASAYRRRKTPLYSFKVCCLKEPTDKVNPMLIRRLNACNLGSRKVVIGRNEGIVKFRKTIRDLYPALGDTDFTFKTASSTSGNRLVTVEENLGLRSLKHEVKFKSLYVVPAHVLDVQEENHAPLNPSDHSDEELENPGLTENMELSTERNPVHTQQPAAEPLPTINYRRPRRRTATAATDFIRAVNSTERRRQSRSAAVTTQNSTERRRQSSSAAVTTQNSTENRQNARSNMTGETAQNSTERRRQSSSAAVTTQNSTERRRQSSSAAVTTQNSTENRQNARSNMTGETAQVMEQVSMESQLNRRTFLCG